MSQLPGAPVPTHTHMPERQVPYATLKPVVGGWVVRRYRVDGQPGLVTFHESLPYARRVARRWTSFAMRRYRRNLHLLTRL